MLNTEPSQPLSSHTSKSPDSPGRFMDATAALLELRQSRPYWGPRRLVFELAKRRVVPVPSESAAYRALVRAGMIDPSARDRRSRKWKRSERGAPMELWQMDIVAGSRWRMAPAPKR
jgi:hypothetical protein